MGAFYRDLIRKHSKAKGSARAVLNILADYADDDGLAWPGRAQLASDTGMSERNVVRCIQTLCADGRLSIEENAKGGRGRLPVYKIHFPELQKGDNLTPIGEKRVTNARIKGDKSVIKGDKSVVNYSRARSEPQEPHKEPGESAPAGDAALELKQAMYQAVCKVVGWDRKTIPKLDQQEAAETATILLNAGYVVDDMDRFLTEVWAHDWRWKKNRERPKPKQIREEIGKLRAPLPEVMFTNGTGAYGAPPGPGATSQAKKDAMITRANSARSKIRTAQYTGAPIDPQWQKDIDAARGLT